MITHLEPDILEYEVKWALGSITMNKASGGDGIPVELFQNPKKQCWENAALNLSANLEISAGPQDWKRSVFIPTSKKANAKECSNYHTIALISHASNVILKILQARIQPYVNRELPEGQAGFRKVRGIRDPTANISWIIVKA